MLIHSTSEFSAWRKSVANQTVAFVPTMGALHSGHHSLIAYAAQQCDLVVVSIFVNALQFGDASDYDKYPRDEHSDYLASVSAGANIVFAPQQQDMFPSDFDRYLTPSSLANEYEGKHRPGHFAGVVTVVHRLFDIVQPDLFYYGGLIRSIRVARMAEVRGLWGEIGALPRMWPWGRGRKGFDKSSGCLSIIWLE